MGIQRVNVTWDVSITKHASLALEEYKLNENYTEGKSLECATFQAGIERLTNTNMVRARIPEHSLAKLARSCVRKWYKLNQKEWKEKKGRAMPLTLHEMLNPPTLGLAT